MFQNCFWIMRKLDSEHILLRGKLHPKTDSIVSETSASTTATTGEVTSHPANINYTEELLDFFDNAPIALHWLSGTGHVLWANKMEMESLGYTREEYIGHHIKEVTNY